MTIEQIKEEIAKTKREYQDFLKERDRMQSDFRRKLSALEDKKVEADPINGVFGLIEVYPKRTWFGSYVTIFYKGKGGYWAERDYRHESDGFWSMENDESYHEMDREVSMIDRQCKRTVNSYIGDGEAKVKLAPMNIFKYNMDECGVRIVNDELYDNAPDICFRYWDGQDRLAELTKEDYEYYKNMHEYRSKRPSCTIDNADKVLCKIPKSHRRERLRLIQMGSAVCSYFSRDKRGYTKTPTDKVIVSEYNKMQEDDAAWMRDSRWGIVEELTEAYFERVGINPKTFDTKKAKESVVKSTARHLAKKLKKVKQLTTHELDFFKMMHGASLIKKLTEKGITV